MWSLERAADPKTGNPINFVWSKVGNFTVADDVITGDVKEFDPTLFKWMAFLTGYVLPQGLLHQGRRRRLRGRADRHRPLYGREIRAQRLRAAEGQSELLGRQAGVRDGDHQIRARRGQPRRRDRSRASRR